MRCAPAMLAELRQVRVLQKRSFEVDLGFNQMMSLKGLRNLPAEPEENTFVFIQVKPGIRVDRKSTRLNSSHTVISYAVFCLKKKKKKTTNRTNTQRNR